MSWTKTTIMEEKMRFILAWKSNQFTVTQLCKDFHISRTTAYNLIKQFQLFGIKCFENKSKRPLNMPNKTPVKVEKAILKLKHKYPLWGARKIIKLLESKIDKQLIPCESTVNKILKNNGLVKSRKRRGHKIEPLKPKFDPKLCNEIWSADYKGKFKLGNNRYCHPLTVADSKSRFIFTSKGHYFPTYKAVKQEYTKIFKQFGLPKYLHTDNGVPFASPQSIQRFSKLCYWLIDIGVIPIFSDPASPQQNGRHERMHRDLKAFCTNPPASTLRKQQLIMDQFIKQYNQIRPHEALNMKTPADIHQVSDRKFNPNIKRPDYPPKFKVLKVTKNGAIRWKSYFWIFISNAAIDRYVGLEELGNGIWRVFYRNVILGYFDHNAIKHKQQYLKLKRILV